VAELEDVIITDELARRPARQANFAAENRALASLARAMADAPETILQRLVDAARELTGADVVGISLVEEHGGRAVFRWHAVAGTPPTNLPAATPFEQSVCKVAIERGAPQLMARPGRHFAYVGAMEPPIEEGMLVPFYLNGEAVGAIWLIAHEGGRFDAEDARVVRDLGEFCAAALHVVHSLHAKETELLLANRVIDEQRAARERLEGVTREAAVDRVRMARLFDSVLSSIRDFVYVLGRKGACGTRTGRCWRTGGWAGGSRREAVGRIEVHAGGGGPARGAGARGGGDRTRHERRDHLRECGGGGAPFRVRVRADLWRRRGGGGGGRVGARHHRAPAAQEAIRRSDERHRMAADLVGLTNYEWDLATGEITCDGGCGGCGDWGRVRACTSARCWRRSTRRTARRWTLRSRTRRIRRGTGCASRNTG
jgi:hypothetical protein